MTSKNVANVGSIVTDKTIDSQSLLEMVNQARKQCGEKEVRNNVFMDRIKDELEGEFYKIFVKPSGGIGGRPVEVAEMSIKQALRVAARESKAVRRSLVDKLEDMQAIPAMPTTAAPPARRPPLANAPPRPPTAPVARPAAPSTAPMSIPASKRRPRTCSTSW